METQGNNGCIWIWGRIFIKFINSQIILQTSYRLTCYCAVSLDRPCVVFLFSAWARYWYLVHVLVLQRSRPGSHRQIFFVHLYVAFLSFSWVYRLYSTSVDFQFPIRMVEFVHPRNLYWIFHMNLDCHRNLIPPIPLIHSWGASFSCEIVHFSVFRRPIYWRFLLRAEIPNYRFLSLRWALSRPQCTQQTLSHSSDAHIQCECRIHGRPTLLPSISDKRNLLRVAPVKSSKISMNSNLFRASSQSSSLRNKTQNACAEWRRCWAADFLHWQHREDVHRVQRRDKASKSFLLSIFGAFIHPMDFILIQFFLLVNKTAWQ